MDSGDQHVSPGLSLTHRLAPKVPLNSLASVSSSVTWGIVTDGRGRFHGRLSSDGGTICRALMCHKLCCFTPDLKFKVLNNSGKQNFLFPFHGGGN